MTEQKSCHRPMEGVALQGVIFSLVTCVWAVGGRNEVHLASVGAALMGHTHSLCLCSALPCVSLIPLSHCQNLSA